MQKRLECQIFGRVQMVMFRDFVTRKARARSVVGTVKNNPDGSVSVVAEGEEQKLKELFVFIERGPLLARVDRIDEKWLEPLGGYKNFAIVY